MQANPSFCVSCRDRKDVTPPLEMVGKVNCLNGFFRRLDSIFSRIQPFLFLIDHLLCLDPLLIICRIL